MTINPEEFLSSIEGIPFITRFKTPKSSIFYLDGDMGIEGIPFITRFKT